MPSVELSPPQTLDRSYAEERLWSAVFRGALKDFIICEPQTRRRIRSQQSDRAHKRQAAARWFFDDSYEVGSFRWVADLFTIDAEVVRGRLLAMAERPGPGRRSSADARRQESSDRDRASGRARYNWLEDFTSLRGEGAHPTARPASSAAVRLSCRRTSVRLLPRQIVLPIATFTSLT